ncbi:MAG: exodeoxyribonuclease VII small subunit [Pyrinomonadaceae bacterium]
MKPETAEGKDFESSLGMLERIVRELERGDLPLEKSLQLFEEGVRLTRECQQRLNEAERRIEVLLRGPEGRPIVAAGPDGDGVFNASRKLTKEDDESVF